MDQKSNTIGYDVDYDTLDAYKRQCMNVAKATGTSLLAAGFKEIPASRGESAYLIRGHGMILAFVVEGLGTLNKIAEEVLKESGVSYMEQVHRANFATILNDLTSCGAQPLIANELVSVGEEKYFGNEYATQGAVDGWMRGCLEVGCAWGGGETQKLRDIVVPGTAVLAGAAVGIIKPTKRWIRGNIQAGDAIVIAESTGIHANGVTMARDVAGMFTARYNHKLPNGKTYGQALLEAPHVLYGSLTQAALDDGVELHYVSNITGHGLRKVMRLEKPFTYIIQTLPDPHPVFKFIQDKSGATDRTMYETFNMSAGAAYILPRSSVSQFFAVAGECGYRLLEAGYVERGPRRVALLPLDITFESGEYQVR